MKKGFSNDYIPSKYCAIENARLFAKNFDGQLHPESKSHMYDQPGKRYVKVILADSNQAEMLEADGWKVNQLPPRNEGEEPTYFIKANINYNSKNQPRIFSVIPGQAPVLLNEDTIGSIQSAFVKYVDVTLRMTWIPSYNCWATYVNEMYVVLDDNGIPSFAGKYSAGDEWLPF